MTSLLTALLYAWLAITGLMIILWLVRRRRNRSLVDASAGQAVPHPALVTLDGPNPADRSDTSTPGPGPVGEGPSITLAEPESSVVSTDGEDANRANNDDDDTNDDDTNDDGTNDDMNDTETETDAPEDEDDKIVILGNQGDDLLAGDPTFTDEQNPAGDDAMTSLSDPISETGPPATEEPRTLSEMLDGIELPYDLTPVTAAVEDPDRHLIFLTTHSNAEEVGTKFADELIRLGFGFEPVGLDQAVATRDSDVVSMVIVPKAAEVETGNGPRYGAADSGDVALELWIGRSSAPPVVT